MSEPCTHCKRPESAHHPVTQGCPLPEGRLWTHSNHFTFLSAAEKRLDEVLEQHSRETWK